MKLTILRWFLWVLVMVMVALGIASVRLEDEMYLVLLETETAPHPEPWPQPRVTLFIFEHPEGFSFDFPQLAQPCEVTWEDCPGHHSCISAAEADRRQLAWRKQAARTLRLYGWTVIEPEDEDQTGEVRTTTKSSTRGGRS